MGTAQATAVEGESADGSGARHAEPISRPPSETQCERVKRRDGGRLWDVYTRAEVAAHCSAQSCWLIAHGRVYDVTAFVPRHPGSARAILRHAGEDASADFDFHRAATRTFWRKFQIGVVCDDDEESGVRCVVM
jgi:predicted heme/steroid binding protein